MELDAGEAVVSSFFLWPLGYLFFINRRSSPFTLAKDTLRFRRLILPHAS
jgi:hypothetical protein